MDLITSFAPLLQDYLTGIKECEPLKRLKPLLPFIPEVPDVSGLDSDPLLCGMCHCVLYQPISLLTGRTICKSCYDRKVKNSCEVAYSVNVCLVGVAERHIGRAYRAMKRRVEGNEAAREKRWEEALCHYTQGLQLMEGVPGDHVLLSNRSLAEVSSGMLEEALRDANRSVQRAPFWKKGYYRRAAVLERMGLREEALVLCLMLARSGTTDAAVEQSIVRLGTHLLEAPGPGGVQGACERAWLHVCVERERTQVAGQVVKWHGLEIRGLCAEELECSLCCRLFYRPTATPCGHTLCEPCLNRCLDHNTTCPVCRSPLTPMLGKYQHKPCVAMDTILQECLPEAYAEREREHWAEQGANENLSGILSAEGDTRSFELPIFVCTLAFPFVQCGLHIFEPRYRLMIRQAWESQSKCFGMCVPLGDTFSDHGTVLKITSHQILDDGRVMIHALGVRRFSVVSHDKRDGYVVARVCLISDTTRQLEPHQESRVSTFYEVMAGAFSFLSPQLGGIPGMREGQGGPDGPGWLWYGLSCMAQMRDRTVSHEVLSGTSVRARYQLLVDMFNIPI